MQSVREQFFILDSIPLMPLEQLVQVDRRRASLPSDLKHGIGVLPTGLVALAGIVDRDPPTPKKREERFGVARRRRKEEDVRAVFFLEEADKRSQVSHKVFERDL